jgi:hypothetical protein
MGRFHVPEWLFDISPMWLHRLADVTIWPPIGKKKPS